MATRGNPRRQPGMRPAGQQRRRGTPDATPERGDRIRSADEVRALQERLADARDEKDLLSRTAAEATQELEVSRQRYADLYDLAPVGYATLDRHGSVLEINVAGAKLLERGRKSLAGFPLRALVAPRDRAIWRDHLRCCTAAPGEATTELTLILRDGRTCIVQIGSRQIVGIDGQVRLLSTLVDVSARRQAEQVLQMAKDELEQLVQTRTAALSQALATLEVRTVQLRALAAERTLAEQRERRRLAEMLHDGLQQFLVAARLRATTLGQSRDEHVRQVSDEILALLQEALTAARSLTGQLSPPSLRRGDVRAALKWLSGWMEETHRLTVRIHGPVTPLPALPEDVAGLIYQAVRELLFNTVKHAKAPVADVTLEDVADTLQVTVADAGVGFDPARLRVLGGSEGGFGLLDIRERLELAGGRLDIRSVPGQGSRMSVRLPIQTAPSAPLVPSIPPTAEPPRAATLRILLADDHVVVRRGLAELLRTEPDFEVVGEAADGKEAVDLACQLRPDVVTMDVNMPRLDGIEATRQLRALCPDVRVIGLSMFADDAHAKAMRDAGAAAHLAKSGSAEELLAAIRGKR